ncbi:HsmA family protein [Rhodococcus tukisamuensis]|uniref:TIGR03987 family protein n=1 Tax=Rhodococcus tukisamuensis TaxID=168276 RepID=A0A1G6T1K4_9NOCA|nr:HsmA family protein [Rhodococcus tukisamuensis]SDD22918.1 TIGR03987 family protein [Rhodococcus tukisamuensis]
MLATAIIVITFALVFYSIGVWSERIQKTLKWWHAGAFTLGLVCDATGTFLMSKISDESSEAGTSTFDQIMIVTGALAIVLMAIHLVWAVIVLLRDRPSEKAKFHQFSLVVWSIWLVPYFTGAIGAMTG